MLDLLRKRLRREEEGFTLIELMVVVLIIAILIAIAIPTFLGAQNKARDRSAQSDLRNALTAAKTIAVDQAGAFQTSSGALTATDMTTAEPAITFVQGSASASQTAVGVSVSTTTTTNDTVFLVKQSASGTYFGVRALQNGGVTYCSGATNGSGTLTASGCVGSKW